MKSNQKLKVLQIIPSFGVGGAEKIVLDYLSFFDRDSVEITAVSMYQNNNTIYDNQIHNNKLSVIYLDKKLGLDLSIIWKINKVVRDFKPDIIHTHMYTMKYSIIPAIFSRKTKLFHTIHSVPEKDSGKFDRIINKIAFKYLNCKPITLTEDLQSKTNSFYGIKNSILVRNGIDLERYRCTGKNKADAKADLGLPADSFVIGHVGRFSSEKNHKFIIDVFESFIKTERNAYLLLVGDGDLKKEIELKVQNLRLSNVRFLGLRKDIPEILKAMDVFIFPSYYEGFPITLIEAQAAGIRCVSSNQISDESILSENTISLGLDDTPEAWCEAIRDNTRKSLTKYFLDSCDIKKIVKILEEVYRKS